MYINIYSTYSRGLVFLNERSEHIFWGLTQTHGSGASLRQSTQRNGRRFSPPHGSSKCRNSDMYKYETFCRCGLWMHFKTEHAHGSRISVWQTGTSEHMKWRALGGANRIARNKLCLLVIRRKLCRKEHNPWRSRRHWLINKFATNFPICWTKSSHYLQQFWNTALMIRITYRKDILQKERASYKEKENWKNGDHGVFQVVRVLKWES